MKETFPTTCSLSQIALHPQRLKFCKNSSAMSLIASDDQMTELCIGACMNDEGSDNFVDYSVMCWMRLRKTKQYTPQLFTACETTFSARISVAINTLTHPHGVYLIKHTDCLTFTSVHEKCGNPTTTVSAPGLQFTRSTAGSCRRLVSVFRN